MDGNDPYFRGKYFINYPTFEHLGKTCILCIFLLDLEAVDCVEAYLI
jgi:hypothetical protein